MNKNFLSKKSWHTGSLKHIEKVWKAEQRHEDEQKRLAELQRQLEQEREIHKLYEIKGETGKYKKKQERLDWMYEVPLAFKTQSTEEYLLGKPVDDKKEAEDLKTPGLFQNKSVSAATDTWNRLREDPLLTIKKQEQTLRDSIRNNPIEMKHIREKLLAMEKERKQQKKDKKRKRSESEDSNEKKNETKKESTGTEGEGGPVRRPLVYSNGRLRPYSGNHRPRYRPQNFTEEEKAARLREMQEDADKHRTDRLTRLKDDSSDTQRSSDPYAPNFLNKMNKQIYDESNEGIEGRLKRNVHFREKGNIDEKGIFK